ncbi:MAG: hypothetical protein ACM3VT_07340, partial [Solirubrobacterales bacterium]
GRKREPATFRTSVDLPPRGKALLIDLQRSYHRKHILTVGLELFSQHTDGERAALIAESSRRNEDPADVIRLFRAVVNAVGPEVYPTFEKILAEARSQAAEEAATLKAAQTSAQKQQREARRRGHKAS